MEGWHRVGQKVVCIDNRGAPELKLGGIYTFLHVFWWWDGLACHLEEQDVGEPDIYEGFCIQRFRPVRETSIECFRSLLSPAPEQARELEDA